MRLHNSPVKRRRRAGAAMIEFAITAPLVFVVIFASFEICRVNMIRHTMDNAAYEGARQGIVPNSSAKTARDATATILSSVGVRGATITISPATITSTTPQITVTVDVPLSQNSWSSPIMIFAGRSVTASCTLDREMAN